GRRLQAAVRQAGDRELPERPVQADCARRRDGHRAVARSDADGIVPAGRSGRAAAGGDRHDGAPIGGGGRHPRRGRDRRLLLPVPDLVRASQDVAQGDEGGVQAVGRRPARQGPDQAVAGAARQVAN
ncbi:hypothetical protein QT20_00030, partial [Staphylococcus aureus]